MPTLSLILKEILFRKLNFLLSLLGVLVAVCLFVFSFTAGDASRRETARLMRNLGLNLRILPRETDMTRFWARGFSEETMPEEYVRKLASQPGLSYSHLLPTLKRRMDWKGQEIILVGVAPEVAPVDHKKPSMSFVVEPGTLFVGNQLVNSLGLSKGDQVELGGEKLRVAACLAESGTAQDISVFGDLRDVQRIAGLEGRINEIQALNCLCLDDERDSLEILREQLETALPEARVIQIRPMADAREEQRRMIENYLAVVLPFVLVVAAAWVGLLAFINVRERWREIGILRALGHGSEKISTLFLGRAVLIGLLGALVGFTLGTWLALAFGPGVFKVTANRIQPHFGLLGWALVAAPVLSALAAFLPAMIAVTQDPAVSLRDE